MRPIDTWANYAVNDRESKVYYNGTELTLRQLRVMLKRLKLIISEQEAEEPKEDLNDTNQT